MEVLEVKTTTRKGLSTKWGGREEGNYQREKIWDLFNIHIEYFIFQKWLEKLKDSAVFIINKVISKPPQINKSQGRNASQELRRTSEESILSTSVYVTPLHVKRTSILWKHENEVVSELKIATTTLKC